MLTLETGAVKPVAVAFCEKQLLLAFEKKPPGTPKKIGWGDVRTPCFSKPLPYL